MSQETKEQILQQIQNGTYVNREDVIRDSYIQKYSRETKPATPEDS